jgi:predicted enzyme related to lactoylglutathione lyase
MSHRIVWVDIPALDLDRAIRFYRAVLGAEVTKEGGPGFTFGLFEHAGQDVGGCVYVPEEDNRPSLMGPLVYLNADGRLQDAVTAVPAQGGTVLQPPHPIGPHGWRAVVVDSEGNRVALHSSTP